MLIVFLTFMYYCLSSELLKESKKMAAKYEVWLNEHCNVTSIVPGSIPTPPPKVLEEIDAKVWEK